jgi:hypothetical protein
MALVLGHVAETHSVSKGREASMAEESVLQLNEVYVACIPNFAARVSLHLCVWRLVTVFELTD